ncbi:helix-turn-helix domain-containing protein [Paenibacillus sp. FSL R10-2748]|uniref:helix-turn-helix domain-containing protein n=1 Tax=Paenibacillus sp. FSL R10-2748 TaxID=2954658 RepID=UPI0030F64104
MSNELGIWIKHVRDSKGLTLTDVSKISGISIAQLSRIETGKRNVPKPDTLKKISSALDISFNELMIIAGHIDVNDDDVLIKIDDHDSNLYLNEKIKQVARLLVDENGNFLSFLHKELYTIFSSIEINDETRAFYELYKKGLVEYENDPDTLIELTQDTFNLVCNFAILKDVILEKLNFEQKESILNELTKISKRHNLSKSSNSIEDAAKKISLNDTKDLEKFLNQPEIKFNGKLITNELKQRILGYAEALIDQEKKDLKNDF